MSDIDKDINLEQLKELKKIFDVRCLPPHCAVTLCTCRCLDTSLSFHDMRICQFR